MWVYFMITLWLLLALMLSILLLLGIGEWVTARGYDSDMARRASILAGWFAALHFFASIGILMKKRFGYYTAFVLSFLMCFTFPIGTILGIITFRELLRSRQAFGLN